GWGSVRQVPGLSSGSDAAASRRALVRPRRTLQEGRGCGQAGGFGRRGAVRRDGRPACPTAVPAAERAGGLQYRGGPAAAAARVADPGTGAVEGVHRGGRGAPDRAAGGGGGGERPAQSAGGAAGRYGVRADGG